MSPATLREAVICEPLRTPVGGYGGLLRDVSVTALASTVLIALAERTGLAPGAVDDVILGQGYPQRRGTCPRPCGSPRCGLRRGDARAPGRSALRLWPASRARRRHAGADRCRRRGHRWWCGVHEPGRALRDRCALGPEERIGGVQGSAGPRPRHRGRPASPRFGRDDRDGGEPAGELPHLPRGAG